MMGKVIAIAQNTFKEAIRNRIMYIILIFAILMIAGSFVIKDFSIAAHGDVIRICGLFAINFFVIAIAILVGIGLVYNELDKKTLYTIVSKPIDRWQFLLGKYLGLLGTLYLITAVMTVVFLLVTWLLNRQLQDPNFGMATLLSLKAIGLGCIELAIIVAFALLFSSFSTPTLSGFLTMMVFIGGRLNEDIERYAHKVVTDVGGAEDAAKSFFGGIQALLSPEVAAGYGAVIKFCFAKFAALVFPNFEMMAGTKEAIFFDTLDPNLLQMVVKSFPDALLYGIPYTAAVLLIAMFLFGRRNFK